MATEVSKYFMGDLYAADIGIGFLVADSREGDADPLTDEARAIVAATGALASVEALLAAQHAVALAALVAASDGDPNVTLSPINLFEISPKEFELYRGAEVTAPDLSDGLALFQVKR